MSLADRLEELRVLDRLVAGKELHDGANAPPERKDHRRSNGANDVSPVFRALVEARVPYRKACTWLKFLCGANVRNEASVIRDITNTVPGGLERRALAKYIVLRAPKDGHKDDVRQLIAAVLSSPTGEDRLAQLEEEAARNAAS